MRLSALGAQKTKSAAQKTRRFSSLWEPGTDLEVFYPIFWNEDEDRWDLLAGALWGYNVSDFKLLNVGTAFIPALCEYDEDGKPVGTPDICYQFSRIAKAIVEAQKLKAIKEVEAQGLDRATEKAAINSIEDEYDAKNNMNAKKAIISRPVYKIMTEVVAIKDLPNGGYDETAAVVHQNLSDDLIGKLMAIISNSEFAPIHENQDVDFIQVHFSYPQAKTKGLSATKLTVSGLKREDQMISRNPEVYKNVSPMFKFVATDSEVIVKHATNKVPESKIRQALTTYFIRISPDLDTLTEQDDTTITEPLIKNVSIFDEMPEVKRVIHNPMLQKAIKEHEDEEGTKAPTTVEPNPIAESKAPTLSSVIASSETTVATPAAEAPSTNVTEEASAPRVSAATLAVNDNADTSSVEDFELGL